MLRDNPTRRAISSSARGAGYQYLGTLALDDEQVCVSMSVARAEPHVSSRCRIPGATLLVLALGACFV
ncbi:MAG: hypothetical protein AB7I32_16895, partial [Gammaproteobacteria bacterium]